MSPEAQRSRLILADRLAVVRDRWRTSLVLAGLLQLAAGLAALVLLLAGAEALFHFPDGVRWALLVLALAALAAGIGWLVGRPMFERIPLERVARLAETSEPELGNLLIAGLQLGNEEGGQVRPVGGDLVAATVALAAESAAALDPAVIVDRRRRTRLVQFAGASLLLLALVFALAPARMGSALARLAMPGTFIPQKGSVSILGVEPGDATVVAGSDVTVTARIAPAGEGRAPDGRIVYRERSGPEFVRRMESADGETYTYTFSRLEREVRYRIEVGDSQTGRYTLTVVERPEVREVDLAYRYPAYAGLEPVSFPRTRNREIRVPVGTEVTIAVRANHPVVDGRVDIAGAESVRLEPLRGALRPVPGGEVRQLLHRGDR